MTSSHTPLHLPLLIQHQSGPLHTPTTGHAFISAPLPPSLSLPLLTKTAIQALRETQNPNNSTIVPGTAAVDCLIVHWGVVPAQKNNSSSSSGGLAFPATTRLCEENLELVLGYMRGGGGGRGYDFVEIRFREPAANPPLGSFAVGGVAKVGSAQSPMKKERGDQAKGAGGGFKGPSGLDYSS